MSELDRATEIAAAGLDMLLHPRLLALAAIRHADVLILLLAWWWTRGLASRSARAWVAKLPEHTTPGGTGKSVARALRNLLGPGDLGRVADGVAVATRSAVDALSFALGYAIADRDVARTLLLGVVLASIWRATFWAVEAVVTTDEERPALVHVYRETLDLVHWSFRAFGVLLVLTYVALVLAQGATPQELRNLGTTLWLSLLAVTAVGLWRWAPVVRRAVAATESRGGWLSSPHRGPARIAASALGVAVLTCEAANTAWKSICWAESGVATDRGLHVFAEEPGLPPAPDDAVRIVLGAEDRPDLEAHLRSLIELDADWTRHPGAICVVSGSGSGRDLLLARFAERVGAEVLRAPPLADRRSAERWMAGAFGVPEGDVAGAMAERPPQTLVIDDVHRLFLRRVFGVEPLGALLEVVERTATRHRWVLGWHDASWEAVSLVPGLAPLGGIRQVHSMERSEPDALRRAIEAPLASAGFTLAASYVVPPGSAPEEVARLGRDAASAWWRWVARAADGNPSAAREIASTGLRTGHAPRTLVLTRPWIPDARLFRSLNREELFFLQAVAVHERLSLDALAEVAGVDRALVGTLARKLELLGPVRLTEPPHGGRPEVELQPGWLGAVPLELRRCRLLV